MILSNAIEIEIVVVLLVIFGGIYILMQELCIVKKSRILL